MITDRIDSVTGIPPAFVKLREAHLKKDGRGTVCENCVAYS